MTRRPPASAVACLLLACLFAWLLALPAMAASADYRVDPVHTRVMIAVEHAGFSKAIGTVSGSTGRLLFDPDDWSTAELEVSVPLHKLDLGDEKWNRAALAGNLLGADKFPTATFVSTRIEPIDPQRASVVGNLTLRGVTREVKLDVTLNALKRHPLPPFRRTAGFSATAILSRADFGIDAWKSVIGDEVELRLEVEATRTRRSGADADDADAGGIEDDTDDADSSEAEEAEEATPPTPPEPMP